MSRRRIADESGAVAVTFAIVFLLLVAFSALAVDVGFWYTARRQLQSAADAAALAGCRELSEESGTAEIERAVDEYASRNFSTPLQNPPSSRVAELSVGPDYVKVTCEADAPVFLSHFMLNRGTMLIRAQSVAKVGYLAGAKGPVPFGLTILRVGSLSGRLGTSPWCGFSKQQDGSWERTFPGGSSGALRIQATNSQGFTESFEDLISVAALDPAGRISAMDVDSNTLTQGDTSVHLTVQLVSSLQPGEKLKAKAGGAEVDLAPGLSGAYEADVPVPWEDKGHPCENQTLSVELGKGNAKQTVECVLLLRTSSYVLQDVQAHPAAVLPGDTVRVQVRTLDFQYGVQYELKVVGGESITPGNFGALSFGTLDHSQCGYSYKPPPITHPGESAFQQYVEGGMDFDVHIGDLVEVEPGDMAKGASEGLEERVSGIELLTLAEWESAGRPNSKQVLIVPVVERIQEVAGRKPVRVVAFATFLLQEPLPDHKDPVVGSFVEWTAPGWLVVEDPPDGGLSIKAVHLTDEHLDF